MTPVNIAMQIACKFSTESMRCLDVVIAAPTTQASQSNLNKQTDESISFLAGFFLTFMLIGFILGCYFQYKKYKILRIKWTTEFLQEVETVDRIRKMTPEIDEKISSQREKQIETLEKIWKMKP